MPLIPYVKLTGLCWLICCCAAKAAEIYTVAIVPQYNVVQLHTEWTPVLARISRETGVQLELVLSSSFSRFEATVLKGEPDFALANPYQTVLAKKAQGYRPLLRDAVPVTGMLLVRRDSKYEKIEDLNGKEIGFPAANAFCASLYMRSILVEKNITFQAQILGTHANVFRSILNGTVAAGGAVNNTLNDEPMEIRAQLRVLHQTPEAASHPLLVHPRVPQSVSKAVKEAILAMQKDAAGIAMLKDIRLAQPVSANYEADYLYLEKLDIAKFVVADKR